MNPEEYEKMYSQENSYWWFQGRKKIIFKMLNHHELIKDGKTRVLDIGCGTGLILQDISKKAFAIGLDFSHKALSFCCRRKLTNLLRGDVLNLPIADSSIQLVTALDLLEHIEAIQDIGTFETFLKLFPHGAAWGLESVFGANAIGVVKKAYELARNWHIMNPNGTPEEFEKEAPGASEVLKNNLEQ